MYNTLTPQMNRKQINNIITPIICIIVPNNIDTYLSI